MTDTHDRADLTTQARPLDILGISEPEERVYRWLLAHPHSAATEAGQALRLSVGRVQRLLDRIETKGLATHTPGRPRRYLPIAPEVALEAVALRRQEELRLARQKIQELQEQSADAWPNTGPEPVIELIISSEAGHQVFEHIQRSAQSEVIALVRLPVLVSRLDVSPNRSQRIQREAQERGVRFRNIADAEFLSSSDTLRLVRDDIETGQDYRMTPDLPLKMIMVDRRVAFIPLSLKKQEVVTLLVRSSPLLDALHALFETLWQQAMPITLMQDGEFRSRTSESKWPKEAEKLISLLAMGLNDKTIVSEMNISASTLNRRVTELMKLLGARTRFQLGWLADRRLSNTS